MNDQASTPALPNDDAARSPTGEILDVRGPAETKPDTSQTTPETATTTTDKDSASNTEGEKKPTEPAKAPETYADFKVPDNYTLDPKAVEAALPVFKELGLTQDQAQKLVDIQVQRELAIAKGPSEAYAATRADWQSKVLADAEIKAYTTDGKTGIDAVKVDIGRALGTLPPELAAEFRSAMDITGAGDHPAFVKAMWKFAQAIGEGKHVIGKGPSPAGQVDPSRSNKPSPAQAMYPNLS